MAVNALVFDFIGRDKSASKTFERVGQQADSFGSRVGALSGKAVTGVVAVTAALGTLGVTGGAMGLKTAAALQQAQIAFETLLGSGEKARSFLSALKTFAATTPFELPGLIDASRQLIGVGQSASSVIPTLTAWGDASGALGLSQEQFSRAMLAVTQSMAKGKVQAEELGQITEAGVPIWPLLSKAMGKSIPTLQDLAAKGKLLADDVFPALEKQMGKDFGGAMAKQSQTLSGLWSTLMDTLNLGLAGAIQPLVPVLQRVLPQATAFLGKAFTKAAQVLGVFIAKAGPVAGELYNQVAPAIATIAAFVTGKLIPALQSLWVKAQPVLTAIGQLLQTVVLPALRSLWQQGGPVLAKLGTAFGGLSATVGAFIQAILPQLKTFVNQIVAVLGPALRSIGTMLAEDVIPAIQGFITAVTPVVQWFIGTFGPAVVGALSGVVEIVKGALNVIAGTFKVVTALLKGDWGKAWAAIKQIAGGIWQAIKGAFALFVNGGIIKVFRYGLGLLRGIATKAWTWVRGVFTSAIGGIKSLVSRGVGSVVGFFAGLPGRALRAVGGLTVRLAGFFTTALSKAVKAVSEAGAAVVQWFADLPGKILNLTADAGTWLIDAGRKIIQGLWDGIKQVARRMINWVKEHVVDKVRGMWPFSPAKWGPLRQHPMDEAGANLIRGLGDGIARQTPTLLKQMATLSGLVADSGATPGGFKHHRLPQSLAPGRGAAAGNGGDSFTINMRSVDLDERTLGHVLYAARLRQRVGRPR